MRKLILGVSIVAAVASGRPAMADDSDLKGLRSLSILVEGLDNNCGINKDDLTTNLRYILAQSRIHIDPKSDDTFLYLNVNVANNCGAADVNLEAKTMVKVLASHQMAFGAGVWNTGTLLTGSSDLSQRVRDAVEEETKKFVVAWSTANP
jgi:ATP adenylyltransferase/5',5'''-P-1,P-4-tetraphosphate phosphorylase II